MPNKFYFLRFLPLALCVGRLAGECDLCESFVVEMRVVLPSPESADERVGRTVSGILPSGTGIHERRVARRRDHFLWRSGRRRQDDAEEAEEEEEDGKHFEGGQESLRRHLLAVG